LIVDRQLQNRRRAFAAFACLLAVIFIYAPFAAAAWSSHNMACCTGGYCNIPKHHHSKAPADSTAGENCGHGMAGIMDCSMSCCRNPDKAVVASVTFVLPPATLVSSAIFVTRTVERARSIEIPRAIEPLSPPPRTNDAAL
jgi:hypothetical protein